MDNNACEGKIINLGILAHVDAGKTTVTEGLLVHSGVKRHGGRVDDGTTTTDSMAVERSRGMTVRAATVSFPWRGAKINLIDTPGHMDFIAEVERSLAVLDGVILVVSAREGVQPQTRVIFERLCVMRIPAILYINKIDRIGASIAEAMDSIRAWLTRDVLPMQTVDGEGTRAARVSPRPWTDLLEPVAEGDDALLGAYLDDRAIDEAAVHASLRAQVRACQRFPVYMGAALHDIGVAPLLDAVVDLLGGESGLPDAPLSAYVYKVEWDAHDHKWAYLRVLRGTLRIRERVAHVGREEPVFVRGLMAAVDGGFAPAGAIGPGDIGALLDAPYVRCGDFLGEATPLPEGMSAAEPLLTAAVSPADGGSRPALLSALECLAQEDPLLRLSIHPATGEIMLRLFGALQREILLTLLEERFGIAAAFSPVRTLLRAKPRGPARAEIPIFSPGNHHQAGIALEIEPLPAGAGIVYERQVSYGDLLRPFQNAVEEGVLAGLAEGLGDAIVDTRVAFVDMQFSSVTSTPADYRRLAPLVVRQALEAAGLDLYEPWMRFSLAAPLAAQRRVLSALHRLRALTADVAHGEVAFIAEGEAPLDTAKDFSAELMAMTQGQGMIDLTFLEYRQVAP